MATAKDIGKNLLASAPSIAPGASAVALRKALDLARTREAEHLPGWCGPAD